MGKVYVTSLDGDQYNYVYSLVIQDTVIPPPRLNIHLTFFLSSSLQGLSPPVPVPSVVGGHVEYARRSNAA